MDVPASTIACRPSRLLSPSRIKSSSRACRCSLSLLSCFLVHADIGRLLVVQASKTETKGTWAISKHIMQNEGWTAFFKGLNAKMSQTVANSAFMFLVVSTFISTIAFHALDACCSTKRWSACMCGCCATCSAFRAHLRRSRRQLLL